MSGCVEDLTSVWRAAVDGELATFAEACGESHSALVEPIKYVLLGGGKRLRALLALAVCHDSCAKSDSRSALNRARSCAVALEALHAASLVHDDLPALDNDDERRGKPSCHRAFGEATAVLVGDALVGAALHWVLDDETLPTDLRARVSRVLARVWRDLCVGQQLDLQPSENGDAGDRTRMIRLKTGILFGAAASCGAICAGVSDSEAPRYFEWGVRVGECFQALDDLDDGDRPESERVEIERESHAVSRDLSVELGVPDRGMSHGVTRLILGVSV